MNYEEKYKEALKVIESLYNVVRYLSSSDALLTCQTIEKAFPELRESEDEKWRNWLIGHLKGYINQTDNKYAEVCKKAISWLEKQAVQKSWSEEDEQMIQDIIEAMQDIIEAIGTQYDVSDYKEMVDWLKSLKDRVQLQPKQEWSEEDEKMLNGIIEEIRPFGECPDYPTDEDKEYYYGRTKMIDWLKSLKPQNRWKPSEEQMSMLLAVLNDSNNITAESVYIALKLLYNDLKKL